MNSAETWLGMFGLYVAKIAHVFIDLSRTRCVYIQVKPLVTILDG